VVRALSHSPSSGADRAAPDLACSHWTSAQVAAIVRDAHAAPSIGDNDVIRVAPDIDIWDAWPVQDADGTPSDLGDGETLWMALGAPQFPDPDERHGHARIHLVARSAAAWRHIGPAMPEGFSPGSREWSGSAVLADDRETLRLYFTAAGRRGEAETSFEQRLFRADATLVRDDAGFSLVDWRDLTELFARDPAWYMASNAGHGAVGTIKAFRDPAYFRDPADGNHHLFFAGSLAGSKSAFNGVIGSASAPAGAPDAWRIQPPLLSADGLNNELERPHVVHHAGLYYLFWSTQRHVFNPAGPIGPNGLYGMVASQLSGPWEPLNGTGLVLANPEATPLQAYSWLVLPDLEVTSFIDSWGTDGAEGSARRFGATFAPMLRLVLDGTHAGLAP
jgi:levansucrase